MQNMLDFGVLFPNNIKELTLEYLDFYNINNPNLEEIYFRISNKPPNFRTIVKDYSFKLNKTWSLKILIKTSKELKEYNKDFKIIINNNLINIKYKVVLPKIKVYQLNYYDTYSYPIFKIIIKNQLFYQIKLKNENNRDIKISVYCITPEIWKNKLNLKFDYNDIVGPMSNFDIKVSLNSLKIKYLKFIMILSFNNIKIGIPNYIIFTK